MAASANRSVRSSINRMQTSLMQKARCPQRAFAPGAKAGCRPVRPVRAAGTPPEMQEALKQAMQDPKVAAQVQAYAEQLKRPEVQQQMQQMQSMMANPQLQQRMQQLRTDPDFASFWKDIETGGMQALMKYYNDPDFLAKLSSKMGDVVPADGAAPAAAAAVPPAATMPEITNLLEAARYGDEEAVEDFIAIGKDVKMTDKEGRTPLHFAAGYNHPVIAEMLLEAGALVDATDVLGNTPLHYAAGYGRPMMVSLLLNAGADKTATNSKGSNAHSLATADARNPVSQDAQLVARLQV